MDTGRDKHFVAPTTVHLFDDLAIEGHGPEIMLISLIIIKDLPKCKTMIYVCRHFVYFSDSQTVIRD